MKSGVILLLFLFTSFYQDKTTERLPGRWRYVKGSYEYYDSNNHKLKESPMNAISNLDIRLSHDMATISYSNGRSSTTPYTVSQEEGKYYISTNLSGNLFKYQILSVSGNSLVLQKKQKTDMALDGDPAKKAAYCIVKIYLKRKR